MLVQEKGGSLRESFFSNCEQMGRAVGPLLSGIYLHHARYVEGIHSCEWIGCYQHYTRVCIDLFLQIAQLDGLEHCLPVSRSRQEPGQCSIPAGSFRCDKFVRSSLASSMAGFIKGGRFGSLPSCTAAKVVSTVFVCRALSVSQVHSSSLAAAEQCSVQHTSPFSSLKTNLTLSPATCLSVTSEATQPSAVSGCQARVPTSYM